jgi:hypothetical protein
VRFRSVDLCQTLDYRWRELLEKADVMSEGAVRREPEGLVYYGSTSLLLPFESNGGEIPDREAGHLAGVLCGDPHVRLRALRIACREAELRSHGPLGRVVAEVFVRRDRRGLKLDIEVEARVLEQNASLAAGNAKPPKRPGTGRR